jgi:hypothetical protein
MPLRVKRLLPISPLALAFLFCSGSCGRQCESKSAPSTFAYIQGACGPTDGPAVEFYFTSKQGQLGRYEEPYLMISISENLPSSGPRDYSIKSGSFAVLASRCLSPGRCDAAISGTLHLATFSPGKSASGQYELHFHDGKVEMDHFDAAWYSGKPITCG